MEINKEKYQIFLSHCKQSNINFFRGSRAKEINKNLFRKRSIQKCIVRINWINSIQKTNRILIYGLLFPLPTKNISTCEEKIYVKIFFRNIQLRQKTCCHSFWNLNKNSKHSTHISKTLCEGLKILLSQTIPKNYYWK